MHWIQDAAHLIEAYIAVYGAPIIFVIIYFEALGVPLPGESALITMSALASRGDIDLSHALIAAFCGAVLGDSTGYLIGRFGGRPFLLKYGYLVKLTPERLGRIEALFHSKGIWIVMTARFFPILRQLNGVIAGSLHMPWRSFLGANLIGAGAWVLVWGTVPYLLVDDLTQILRR